MFFFFFGTLFTMSLFTTTTQNMFLLEALLDLNLKTKVAPSLNSVLAFPLNAVKIIEITAGVPPASAKLEYFVPLLPTCCKFHPPVCKEKERHLHYITTVRGSVNNTINKIQ